MFIQKTLFLAIFIPMGLYSFSIFHHEDSREKPIYIAPIVIPKSVKENNHREILKKLREATKETFKNAEPKEEEVAEQVLSILAEYVKIKKHKEKNVLSKKNRLARKREVEKKKREAREKEVERKNRVARKKEIERKKRIAREKEIERKKRVARKKEIERKKRVARKKEIERKKRVARRKEIERKRRVARRKEIERKRRVARKKEIFLGEQDDLHNLSKERMKYFHNLEVVHKSKEFTLEEETEFKNPKFYDAIEKEVNLEELPFVKTLGVVNVSKPFIEKKNY